MTLSTLGWGSPDWLLPAAALLAIAVTVLLRAYARAASTPAVRIGAATLKVLGLLVLALCLLEPLAHGRRARPGANLFVVLADNSESLRMRDAGRDRSRGEHMREWLRKGAPWRTRLEQDFDVRKYVFDNRLGAVADFDELTFEGAGTSLASALEGVARRYRDRPLAGVLLLTDGNATDVDLDALDASALPPVYPVVVGESGVGRDLGVRRVTVSQTNFESAPVTVEAEVAHQGYAGEEIVTQILDGAGAVLEEAAQEVQGSQPLVTRFQLRPETSGIQFYGIRVAARQELDQFDRSEASPEATIGNNQRLVTIDRGTGPYRILYVSGRPNWEFKFLRRALEEDPEIELVGLIRIARREPKFDYRSRRGESTNPLFRGFGAEEDEEAERYDEPVLLRLGTVDEEELRDGFPLSADRLFRYHAVVLDDVEAEYFSVDQLDLLRDFVSRRGGGLLMLGGQESFSRGGYDRTPVGELLPVHVTGVPPVSGGTEFRLSLTREGWVQPWMRLRETESAERGRLEEMPPFRVLNPVRGIKPGATVLARVTGADGRTLPALVAQRFGKGRAAAVLVGDLWRWGLRRPAVEENDQAKAWRQTLRWLVADVPRRVETGAHVQPGVPGAPVRLAVRVRDEEYQPLDNATVALEVTAPDGSTVELRAEASTKEAGLYEAVHASRQIGAYRARVTVQGPDGSEVGESAAGWTADPSVSEYRELVPDRAGLENLARRSGGELVRADDLDDFVAGLPDRKIPITDPWTYPLWHHWSVLIFALLCLCGEWALRRWKGLP